MCVTYLHTTNQPYWEIQRSTSSKTNMQCIQQRCANFASTDTIDKTRKPHQQWVLKIPNKEWSYLYKDPVHLTTTQTQDYKHLLQGRPIYQQVPPTNPEHYNKLSPTSPLKANCPILSKETYLKVSQDNKHHVRFFFGFQDPARHTKGLLLLGWYYCNWLHYGGTPGHNRYSK